MNSKKRLIYISLGIVIDFVIILAVVLTNGKSTNLENNVNNIAVANMNVKQAIPNTDEKMIQSEQEENNEIIIEEQEEEIVEETPVVIEEPVVEQNVEPVVSEDFISVYDNMSIEEKEQALNNGTLHLEYSGLYTNSSDRLTVARGALYFNNHKETYYSEKVLPGASLNIPGRHVADDGTVRDGDGYICVATNYEYMAKGTILITSLGPAKVYDTGCAYGTVDIYVSW